MAKCLGGVLLLACAGARVCGYAAAFRWHGAIVELTDHAPRRPGRVWWRLHDIAIAETYRGTGLGRMLLESLVREGTSRSIEESRAVAVSAAGLALLHRSGFRPRPELNPPRTCPGSLVVSRTLTP